MLKINRILISLAALLALSACNVTHTGPNHERSDPHRIERKDPSGGIDRCADCDPPHNLPVPR